MKIEEFEFEYDFRGRGKETIYIECDVTTEEKKDSREDRCIGDAIVFEEYEYTEVTDIIDLKATYRDEFDELCDLNERQLHDLKHFLLSSCILMEKLC